MAGFTSFTDNGNYSTGASWGVNADTPTTDVFGVNFDSNVNSAADGLFKLIDNAKDVYACKLNSDTEVRKLIDALRVNQGVKMTKEEFLERIGKVYARLAMDVMDNALANKDRRIIDGVCKELTSRFAKVDGGSAFVDLDDDNGSTLQNILSEFKLFIYENKGDIPSKFAKFKNLWDMFKVKKEQYLALDPAVVFDSLKRLNK